MVCRGRHPVLFQGLTHRPTCSHQRGKELTAIPVHTDSTNVQFLVRKSRYVDTTLSTHISAARTTSSSTTLADPLQTVNRSPYSQKSQDSPQLRYCVGCNRCVMESSPHSSASPHRMIDSWVNRPIHFDSGYFQGQTIRAELKEIQKADLGRKYARVDRRPLDPPPVVQLRLYQVFNYGTDAQYERELCDYSEVQTRGLLCCVDLFPAPMHTPESAQVSGREPRQLPRVTSGLDLPESSSSRPPSYHRYTCYGVNPHTTTTQNPSISHENVSAVSSSAVLTYVDGCHPITEDMKRTSFLSGALFVQPAVIDYNGRKALVFAFSDLAVKAEGLFFLRYRCFDLYSRIFGQEEVPMQSECFGGQFRIYSTKEFPGLQASTELTKQLARYGVRLNTRETERKRKRKSPPSTSGSASMKGKERETDSGSDYE